jgi:chromosome segregation ATPase
LVERLLNDFLKTTTAFQKVKKDNNMVLAELENERSKVIPLVHEIDRIVNENNQLHQAIIQAEEQAKEIQIKYYHEELKYKSQIDDLKFVITNKDGKLKILEEQSKEKLSSRSEGSGFTRDNTDRAPLRDSTNERLNNTDSMMQELDNARRHCADELIEADEKIAGLRAEVRRIDNSKVELNDTIRLQIEKLEVRDREISRLNSIKNEGPNIDNMSHAYTNELSKASIQKLNNQIDFLNMQNQKLDSQLQEKIQVMDTAENFKKDKIALSQKCISFQSENIRLIDDIKTMENVIQELKDKVKESSSVMSKKNYVPLADLNTEKESKNQLKDDVIALESQIRQYKRADEINQDRINSSDSEVKTLTTRLDELILENRDQNSRLDEQLHEVKKVKHEREKAKDDAEFYKERAKQMEHNYETYKKMKEDIYQEKEVTEEERSKYHNKLIKIENELSETRRTSSEVNYELERLKRQKELNDAELDDLRQNSAKFRNEADNNTATLSRVHIQNETNKKQLEYAQKDKDIIGSELQAKTTQITQLERQVKMLKQELESAQDSISIMRSEHKMLSDDLSEKITEHEMEVRKKRDTERELSEYKHLKNKFESIEDRIESIVTQKAEIEKDNTKLKSKVIELESVVRAKEKFTEESDRKYQEVCIKLSEAERRGMKKETTYDMNSQYKYDAEDKQRIINELRTKETDQLERLESIQSEVKKLRYDIGVEKDRASNYKESKEKVDYELREARKNLTDLEQEISVGKNQVLINEQHRSQSSLEVDELKKQVSNMKNNKNDLEEDNREIRKKLDEMKSNTNKLESLIQTLERSKDDLVGKFQNVNKEKNNEERDKSMLITEIAQLKKSIVEKESEIHEIRS